jgi:archaellum component FlaC
MEEHYMPKINYRRQIGFLRGLCSGLSYEANSPESKLLLAIIDMLDSITSELDMIKNEIDDLGDDLQDLSDEVSELESISDDIETLGDQLEFLGDFMEQISEMTGETLEDDNLVRPIVQRPIRLVTNDGEFLDDDDEE